MIRADSAGEADNAAALGGKSLAQLLLAVYPVGAVYISTVNASPASPFGGAWEQIQDCFLLAARRRIP